MADGAQTDPSLNKTEHVDENISAKRTANYGWDGSNWQRQKVDGSGNVSTSSGSGAVNVGQQTTNTTAVQLSSVSTVPTNGIIVEALSSNSAESIFIGGSGVTTSNGYELQTGASIAFTCNLNTLYIISATSTTNKVCWNVV